MKADPTMLTDRFNSLLHQLVFPPAWKKGMCVPIPKRGRSDLWIQKNLQPISPLSCLSKKFEQLLTQRIAWAAKLTGAISLDYLGSWAGFSTLHTVMPTLKPAQEWLLELATITKRSRGP